MKSTILAAIVVFLTSGLLDQQTQAAPIREKQFGVGIEFFGPAGISVYDKIDTNRFLQGALAFDRWGDFVITGDYAFAQHGEIFHNPNVTPYWGVGGLLIHETNDYLIYHHRQILDDGSRTYIGGRIPLGINFLIPDTPIQLGAEIVPGILLLPGTDVFLTAALHIRVMF